MSTVRVAIVDDSAFIRKALRRILGKSGIVEVVGVAASGEELLESLDVWKPDVITLDLSMPGIGGLRTLDRVRRLATTPIIILSTHSQRDAPQTIEALHRGAVDFIDKQQYSLVDFQALGDVLLEKIVSVAEQLPARQSSTPKPVLEQDTQPTATVHADYELFVVGASTGGPLAVQELLSGLGDDFPVPVVVVQHMPVGFTGAFAERLNSHLSMSVREASDSESLSPGCAYIAPAGRHAILELSSRLRLRLVDEPGTLHCPSIDRLFHSAAEVLGQRVIAALLTGMGRDGADGMAALHNAGAPTIAQNAETCVIYGMPGAAVAAGGVSEELPLGEIGSRARALVRPVSVQG